MTNASLRQIEADRVALSEECLPRFCELLRDVPAERRIVTAIGGHPVELCFGDESLEPVICKALSQTGDVANGATPFRIVLHTLSSDIPLPAPTHAAANDIFMLDDGDWTFVWQRNGEFVSCVDWLRNTGYWIASDAVCIPFIERAAPLKHLLTLWLGRQGKILTHAAAVGVGSEGVLVLGAGGSGKSTTSILCMTHGLSFVSDDHCLVSVDDEPTVHSLYTSVKISAEDYDQLPDIASVPCLSGRPPEEKMVLLLNENRNLRLAPKLRIRGLFLAQITPQEDSCLRPVGPAQAFKALAASAALHLPAERRNALGTFSTLGRHVPAYVLELGSNRKRIPEVIHNYLAMVN